MDINTFYKTRNKTKGEKEKKKINIDNKKIVSNYGNKNKINTSSVDTLHLKGGNEPVSLGFHPDIRTTAYIEDTLMNTGKVYTYPIVDNDIVNKKYVDDNSGDVEGPLSSTDNALVRFDGTDGKTIQNSGAILDDTGNLTGLNNLYLTGFTQIDSIPIPPNPPVDQGRLYKKTGDDGIWWLLDDGTEYNLLALSTGDVVGPMSSTDNAIVRFDLTSGKLIQNSGVIIDDANTMTGINNLSAINTLLSGYEQFTSIPTPANPPANNGRLYRKNASNGLWWRQSDGSEVDLTNTGGDVFGPGSSTDNALVRFDSTTGKIIQNSGAILDDSDNLTGLNSLTSTNISNTTFNGDTINGTTSTITTMNGTTLNITNIFASGFEQFNQIATPTNPPVNQGRLYRKTASTGLWWLQSDGSEVDLTNSGGDVFGPVSSTDNALVRFDSTTGKIIQNSGAILDDIGNLTGLNSLSSTTISNTTFNGNTINGTTSTITTMNGTNTLLGGYIQLNQIATPANPPANQGRLYRKNASTGLWWRQSDGSETDLTDKAPLTATYVTMSADATLPNERILTETLRQIRLTNGGPGGNATLSLYDVVRIGSLDNYSATGTDDGLLLVGDSTITGSTNKTRSLIVGSSGNSISGAIDQTIISGSNNTISATFNQSRLLGSSNVVSGAGLLQNINLIGDSLTVNQATDTNGLTLIGTNITATDLPLQPFGMTLFEGGSLDVGSTFYNVAAPGDAYLTNNANLQGINILSGANGDIRIGGNTTTKTRFIDRCPETSIAPTIGEHLTNKTYVDNMINGSAPVLRSFYIEKSTSQSVTGSYTSVTFQTIHDNLNSCVTVLSSTQYAVNNTGYYQVVFSGMYTSPSIDTPGTASCEINRNAIARLKWTEIRAEASSFGSGGARFPVNLHWEGTLTAGDYIIIFGSGSGTWTIGSASSPTAAGLFIRQIGSNLTVNTLAEQLILSSFGQSDYITSTLNTKYPNTRHIWYNKLAIAGGIDMFINTGETIIAIEITITTKPTMPQWPAYLWADAGGGISNLNDMPFFMLPPPGTTKTYTRYMTQGTGSRSCADGTYTSLWDNTTTNVLGSTTNVLSMIGTTGTFWGLVWTLGILNINGIVENYNSLAVGGINLLTNPSASDYFSAIQIRGRY
ncbi:MAG: hypothetical protein KIT69_01820 [Propionibacteriaceae bacterium]|nr:hypothetical protein [Propionibacteriaceae bacterium]